MRFRGWHIDGFGVFHDYSLSDLPDGLIVLHGPNEAGKSTLLAFLRGVLFGFADGRNPESLYPPLNGGRHGGALFLDSADGIFRIDRAAGRRATPSIVRPDGTQGDAADLAHLLGDADDTLFRSVFAFSLQELTEMASLSSEGVRARIFSAGIAGAGRSARDVIEEVEHAASVLLKPRAGRIRELITEAQALRVRMVAGAAAAAQYPDLLAKEEAALSDLESLRASAVAALAAVSRLAKLLELWPTEVELQEKRHALLALPTAPHFPDDAEGRLTAAVTRRAGADVALVSANRELTTLDGRRHPIQLDARLAGASALAEAMAAEIAVHRERLERLAIQRQVLRGAETALASAIEELGPAWSEGRLRSFDTSLPTVEEVRTFQLQLEAARNAAAEATAALEEFDAAVRTVEGDLERLDCELRQADPGTTSDQFEAAAGGLATLADRITSVLALQPGVVGVQEELASAIAELSRAEREELQLREALRTCKANAQALRPDPTLDSVHPVIAEVARHLELQHHRLSELQLRTREDADSRAGMERSIAELGSGWDEGRVRALPSDFSQVQRIRQFVDDIVRARDAVKEAERDAESVRRGISARQKDLDRLRPTLDGPEPRRVEELLRDSAAIRRLRVNLADLAATESRLRADEALKADRQRPLGAASVLGDMLPPWLVPVAVLLAIASAAGGVWRLRSGDPVATVLLLAVGLILAFTAVALRRRHTWPRGEGAGESEQNLKAQLRDLDQSLAALAENVTQLRGRIAADAQTLGLQPLPSATDVEERDERRERQRDERRTRDEVETEIGRIERELDSFRETETNRKQVHEARLGDEATVAAEWVKWSQASGLPSGLSPSSAADFLQQVREAQERIRAHDSATKELESLRLDVDAWEIQARHALDLRFDGAAAASAGDDLVDALAAIQRECSADSDHRRDRARLENEVEAKAELCLAASGRLAEVRAGAKHAAGNEVERLRAEWRRTEPLRRGSHRTLEDRIGEAAVKEAAWRTWQEERQIDRPLSPDGVLDFFNLVRRAREAMRHRDETRSSVAEADRTAQDWRLRAEGLMAEAGIGMPPGANDDAVLQATRDLARRCSEDDSARREAAGLDEAIAEATRTLEDARHRFNDADAELNGVLADVAASDEEEYRTKLAAFKVEQRLQLEVAELERRIVAVIGRGEDADRLRAELREGHVGLWQKEHDRDKTKASQLEAQHEQAIRAHQNLVNARSDLETTADVASIELEYQGVLAELSASLERWRALRLARGLVQETLGEFERTRQPQVLATASGLFSRVTSGRFARIVQHEDGDNVAIIDQTGARREVTELSRGTREQLYLCIRLGLAEEFGRRVQPLPLVMDDVLVNFDAVRARQMARELLVFAEHHQVLLFTCHSYTRDLLRDLQPGVPVIELPVLDLPAVTRVQPQQPIGEPGNSDCEGAGATEQDVLDMLRDGALGIGDLAERLGCPPDRLRPILSHLRESGQLAMVGQRRGARYALAAVGSQLG